MEERREEGKGRVKKWVHTVNPTLCRRVKHVRTLATVVHSSSTDIALAVTDTINGIIERELWGEWRGDVARTSRR